MIIYYTILILAAIFGFFYMATTTVTFHPFSFKCETLGRAVGLTLMLIGFWYYTYSIYRQGVHDGVQGAKDAIFTWAKGQSGTITDTATVEDADDTTK